MKDTDIIRDFGNLRLSIFEAGEWTDEETKETKEYAAGIKLSKGGYGIKLSAHDLAGLYQALRTDDEVRKELEKRLAAEKLQMAGAKF